MSKEQSIEKKIADFVGQGFHPLDEDIVSLRPPQIRWGEQYLSRSDEGKIEYLEKLASTMNHAAAVIQDERNQLNELCDKKEKQIESMKVAIDQNNEMIQQQVTKMNSERQLYNQAIAELKAKIRSLENGDNG